ncbi:MULTISPECIES: hypothetical protein [Pseudomonas]|uniref:hypothetical protein n=1 Tax=Pseudomonas TaxID=286 RepID=UPI000A116AA7|nr:MULTISPECIES: hypothetical protein [Pseudomonas]MBO0365562.1 hypothetical protein [Pseudomonas putida]
MILLNTYDDHDDAKEAESLLIGNKRLASERDGTQTIYNLFGEASWRNFHSLKMFNLTQLQALLEQRNDWSDIQSRKHSEILNQLYICAKNFNLTIPEHWK